MGVCAMHMESISAQLRNVLQSYYDRMHEQKIARSVWLPHVQGFFAWGVGHMDEASGEWIRFDGLSGNQVLLFQALDAFLGIEPYLSLRDRERNVPARQRALCSVFEKHSFRRQLNDTPQDADTDRIRAQFDEILKRLRLFRTVHKTRAKSYLSQPAPERLPMTAGKSLLKADMDQSLEFLEGFMTGRLVRTM
ncbi:hypothetical protein UCDDA912_g07795 [Diaporthe ampelina]|uniref:Uncharacterized protein n=1 Tax=Diaporthe ampelina TaxID=1214573 RepID=A0A0G2FDL4_9PEZI|nr:hypothetical protein UCDDA912_g07795 [Diaporthe ampelina]